MSNAIKSLPRVKLTPDQERKWIETRATLLWKCPAFTYVLFQMLNPERGELAAIFVPNTKEVGIPYAATDGSNLIINPETFFKMPLMERIFVVAHEIMHCILNHCVLGHHMNRTGQVKFADGTSLPYVHELMNMAMDYVINDLLISDKIGEFPKVGLHDPKIGTKDDNFVDVYRRLFKQAEQQSKKMGGGGAGDGDKDGGGGQKGFDVILAPGTAQGKDPQQAEQERSSTAWATAVAAAIASAKAQGKLPAGMERLLSEVVEPTVPWQDHIRSFFSRKIGGGSYDWKRPDKRMIQRDIYIPRRSGNGCGPVAVAIDTSGSIGQRELDAFFGELKSILDDVQPSIVYVIWCDAKVHHVDEIDKNDDLGGLKPRGGGGTDFRPVFEWVWDNDIHLEALVYLTDGFGSFPDTPPSYPVIWGDIHQRSARYPAWAEVVDVKLQ